MKFRVESSTPSNTDLKRLNLLKGSLLFDLDATTIAKNPLIMNKLEELNTAVAIANEGFLDKLKYTFTSDAKCATMIDELVKTLNGLDAEGLKKFDDIVIDYPVQDKKTIDALMKYVDTVVKWCSENLDEIKQTLRSLSNALGGRQDEVREAFLSMQEEIEKKLPYNVKQYKLLIKGRNVGGSARPKGKTLKELGYSKAVVLSVIKDFKANCSGNLKVFKTLRNIVDSVTHEYGYNVTTVHTYMFPVLTFCNTAIDVYKYIDYFIYYIGKKI